jgi:hypothetical protein
LIVHLVERLYCKRPILWLESSKILTPHPPRRPASVYPPPLVRGEDTLAGWRGGGGSIFWKTQDTALYSTYVSTLWFTSTITPLFQERSYRSKGSRRSNKRRGSGADCSDPLAADEMDHLRSGGSGSGGGVGGGPPEIRSARVAKSPLLSDRSAAATLVDGGSDGQSAARSWHDGRRPSPDKVSRDSGVPSPSDAGSVTTDSGEQAVATFGLPTDKDASFASGADAPDEKPNGVAAAADSGGPAPVVETNPTSDVGSSGQSARTSVQLAGRPVPDSPAVRYAQPSRLNGGPLPVKAELVTNELDPTFSGE